MKVKSSQNLYLNEIASPIKITIRYTSPRKTCLLLKFALAKPRRTKTGCCSVIDWYGVGAAFGAVKMQVIMHKS